MNFSKDEREIWRSLSWDGNYFKESILWRKEKKKVFIKCNIVQCSSIEPAIKSKHEGMC